MSSPSTAALPDSPSPGPACPLVPFTAKHPDEFYPSGWDSEAKRPVVGGKYEDPATGELRDACGITTGGPPSVDLFVSNVHVSSLAHAMRASRPLPMRTLLRHLLSVVEKHNLDIDSVTATPYAIRLVLSHEFASLNEWMVVSNEMGFGYRSDWTGDTHAAIMAHMSSPHC